MKKASFFILIILSSFLISAQEKSPVKFGKISPDDFKTKIPSIDSNAAAVIIADIGNTNFIVNEQQQFALVFERKTRIKLINKNGFDAATVKILLYYEGSNEEKLEKLKASTYNLEGEKINEIKLSKNDLYTEKINSHWIAKNFTLPGIKEGSIIEYSYSITSNYIFNLQSWDFQGVYPCLWSEYEAVIPEYFTYAILSQGFLSFTEKKDDESRQNFTVTTDQTFEKYAGHYTKIINGGEKVNISTKVNIHRWVIKDVPGLKLEKFTSSFNNYISRIDFQLSQIKYPEQLAESYLHDWIEVNQQLLGNEDFGIALNRPNNWMDDDIKLIVGNSATPMEKSQKIYTYVINNFTCTGNGLSLSDNIKNIFKNKKGNAADINLLLTTMLRHEKIVADPVILSTRNNGYINPVYPLIDRFNYVICEAIIDGKKNYLDATQPKLGFGYLPLKCYNGYARVISKDAPRAINLVADSIHENKKTMVFIANDEKGNWVGSFSSELGYYESVDVREQINEKDKKDFFEKIKLSYPYDVDIQNASAEPVNDFNSPMTISYEFDLKLNKSNNVIYFNPLLTEGNKDNPFKSAGRSYPVEMPFTKTELYIAEIDIPTGYEIDELPKSEKIQLNGDEGVFEYILVKKGNSILVQCRLWLDRANFAPEDYEGLRDFYGKIIKKQNEQIVFKKK